jgi:transposase
LKNVDGKRELWVNWSLFLEYSSDDASSHRFAAGCLAQAGVAPKTKIAQAFGYHRNYVAKLATKLESEGLEGMLEGKRGPRGPHKAHHPMRRQARELRRQGLSLQTIAEQLAQEWGVSISHTSVRRMVQGVELEQKEGVQASLEGAWPLALPLGRVNASPVLEGAPSPEESKAAASGTASEEGETDQEASKVVVDSPRPVVREGREFSGAGGFLFYPALAALGLIDVFRKVYDELACHSYGVREVVLALFFLWVMRFPSVEAFKGAQRRDFGCLIGTPHSPSVKTLRRKLEELAEQKRGHRLMMEMARRYADGDIVELGVLYADGHMKPYYGSRSLSKVWSPQRRLPMPGVEQYFVNDRKGRPLFFLTAQPQKSLTQMLPELVEHIRSVIGEREFTLVFDRGGYSPKVFGVLRENNVHIITYRRRPFELYPASVFTHKTCQLKGKLHEFNLYEETIHLKGFGLLRNIAVLRDKGRQTHILTSDMRTEAALIACLMFNRWGQENFFKYMLEHYSLDALHGYGAEDIAEDILVANPQRRALDDDIRKLRSETKAAKEKIGEMVGRKASRSQLKSLRERLTLLEKQLSTLRKQRRQLPARVPLAQTDENLEALDLEKKTVVDTIKMGAYNAEEWLLERLDRYYDDPRDTRQVLRILTGLKGQLRLRDGQLVVDLTPPEIPKYRRALLGLCAELNQLSGHFPETPYPIRFTVAGAEMHTKPLCSATPMS